MKWLDSITNRHEFEQDPGDGDGQGSLVCCSPWGCKELDVTEQQNNNKKRRETAMMCHMCSKKMIRLTVAYTVA